MLKKTTVILLCLGMVFQPLLGQAAQKVPGLPKSFAAPMPKQIASPGSDPLPKNALPDLRGIVQGVSSVTTNTANNQLTVDQYESKAIIDWNSFNVGANASVVFDQKKNTDWVALNRIYDANPSKIFGSIKADGKVYLINQNGILFGCGAQVNTHSLVASTLNISDNDFLNGVMHFQGQDYINGTDTINTGASIINRGTIQTDSLGSVFLIGPNVRNGGTITTTAGQIGLLAGTDVTLTPDSSPDSTRTALIASINANPGEAVNTEKGIMTANTGLVGMYGKNVTQNGVIHSVTALKKNGQIELVATDKVSTGVNSITATPVSDSTESAEEGYEFQPGEIHIQGFGASTPVKTIEHRGLLESNGGNITMVAADRVYLEKGSTIDVSGLWINKSASENVVTIQLNSNELRDEFIQKNGTLKGKTITVDPHLGSSIGDISGAYMSAGEDGAGAQPECGNDHGTVPIRRCDRERWRDDRFSRGRNPLCRRRSSHYQLLALNRIFDISDAPSSLHYDVVINPNSGSALTVKHVDSYDEGYNAGSA